MNEDKKISRQTSQNLIMENREKLSLSGVLKVRSFDDETVEIETELGVLIVCGEDLHINKLSIDNSELSIEGYIVSCEYNDSESSRSKGMGFFSKMFR
ncbi:sporulation protein YabP [Acetivibrio cellulolyticus]|uniref:sporulation protein YabP n=1 Tax=Acetivibrio cellulolyticus TaxID=35830 RepID=UPI0001E2D0D6|nr:sporulation protein YabP [Acetivibrio cellulolyticus]